VNILDLTKILMKLDGLCPISGNEVVIGARESLSTFVSEIFPVWKEDSLGNIVCLKKGNGRKKILILGHYDESGFVIKNIDCNGFIKLTSIGYIDEKSMLATQLRIYGTKKIYGICGAKPPHLLSVKDREKKITLESIFLDTGYKLKELSDIIKVGNLVSFDNGINAFMDENYVGSGLSSKGISISLLYLLNKIREEVFEEDIYVAFAGGRVKNYSGLYNLLNLIEPDKVLILEAYPTDFRDSLKVGNGTCILKTPIMPQKVVNGLINSAKFGNCPFQVIVKSPEYNSISKIPQVYRKSCVSGSLGLPVKNYGTSFEMINIRDIKASSDIIFNNLLLQEI
jgi:endoglucanase